MKKRSEVKWSEVKGERKKEDAKVINLNDYFLNFAGILTSSSKTV